MKWTNPAHEFDDEFSNYSKIMDKHHNQVYLFGWGKIGRELYEFCKDSCIEVVGVIDNNREKWGETVDDRIKVISFDTYLSKGDYGYIVVTVAGGYTDEINSQLESYGIKPNEDYCSYNVFKDNIIPLMELYKRNSLWLDVVEIALTERCTLKCMKCAHGCGYVGADSEDMPIEMAQTSIDNLFRITDKLYELYLIGGEPLLYRELITLIEYIGRKYRERIYRLVITTNGTIMPDPDLISVAKKYEVIFCISNYSNTLPYLKDKYNALCQRFEETNIHYELSGIERTWYDYGFDHVDHGFDVGVIERIYDNCFTRCREIRGSKFYYCIQARSVSQNMHFDVKDEYLDLKSLSGRNEKKLLFEFAKGYCKAGYIEMCNYCNGSDSKNFPIPVAIQMKKGD